jgi:hypothetical protein
MPRLPQPTASGQSGSLPMPSISADSFGAQAGRGLSEFGRSLFAVDSHQREQQDRLDTVKLATDLDTQIHEVSQSILAEEPNTQKHLPLFADRMKQVQSELLKGVESRSVQTSFKIHAEQAVAHGQIELATQGRKLNNDRQIANYLTQSDSLMASAAAAGEGEREQVLLSYERDLRNGLVKSGAIKAEQGVKLGEAAQDRRWSIVAQQDPSRIIDYMQREEVPNGMDPTKQHTYTELAFHSMAAKQLQADQAEKRQEAQIKAYQGRNKDLLTAQILEGKSVADKLPILLRSRGLDAGDAGTLRALEHSVKTEPNLANYQPSLSAQIEATLGAMKFSGEPLAQDVETNLVSEFIQGHILKPEFTHLMDVWNGVQSHRSSTGKEAQNREVGHAHSTLVRGLTTTGPADKFDALANQNIEAAEQDFYRRMTKNPDADPWTIAGEVEKIYKPIIKERLNLSEKDKTLLDDAKMEGMRDSKAISPATYKAWQEREQNRRGWAAIEDVRKNLPPPKDTRTYWERLNPFSKKPAEAPRKPSVMSGD